GTDNGINIQAAAAVTVENCVIKNFASGIKITPSSSTTQVNVSDALIANISATGAITAAPTGSGGVNLVAERVRSENNSQGIVVDATGTSAANNAFVRDSVVSGTNGPGILAKGGTGVTAVDVYRSHIVNNNNGVLANTGAAV